MAVVRDVSHLLANSELLTAELANQLKRLKLNAVRMESRTPVRRRLEMDRDTGAEARDKDCDYVLLTQIDDLRQRGLDPLSIPPIGIGSGQRVPSTDASEGPLQRGQGSTVLINFAFYRISRLTPVLDGTVESRAAEASSSSLTFDIDQVANRVNGYLKKK